MKPKINELDITLGTAVELTRQVLALPSGWPRVQALHQIGAARKDLCVSLSYTGWGYNEQELVSYFTIDMRDGSNTPGRRL